MISQAALFGLASLPLVTSQIERNNVVQCRMFPAIIGWVTVDCNDSQGTMRRMNENMKSVGLDFLHFKTRSESGTKI